MQVLLDVRVSDDTTLSQGLSQHMHLGAAPGVAGAAEELDENVAHAIVAASSVLDAGKDSPVVICLKLALDFEYAGEAGSDKRVWFERAVKLDLAAAARIPAHHFVITGMSPGRCLLALSQPAPRLGLPLHDVRQAAPVCLNVCECER